MLSTVGETVEADSNNSNSSTLPPRSPTVEEGEEEEEEEGQEVEVASVLVVEEDQEEEEDEEQEEEDEDKEVTRIFRMADDPQYSEAVTKTRNHSISVMESAADKGRGARESSTCTTQKFCRISLYEYVTEMTLLQSSIRRMLSQIEGINGKFRHIELSKSVISYIF